jgi:hypothetical protein
VYEFETVVDCDSFSYLLNPCGNRVISHGSPLVPQVAPVCRPKEKVGAKPTGRPSVPSSKLWIIRKAFCRGNLATGPSFAPLRLCAFAGDLL